MHAFLRFRNFRRKKNCEGNEGFRSFYFLLKTAFRPIRQNGKKGEGRKRIARRGKTDKEKRIKMEFDESFG